MATNAMETGYDWNDEIEKESNFVELPEGDYDFVIDHYERARFNGNDKIPACNMATVFFNIRTYDNQEAQIRENFILHPRMEWKLSELFSSVGLKGKNEKIHMAWDRLAGLSGRCQVSLDVDKNDSSKKYNHIKKLYPKEPKNWQGGFK